MKPVHFIGVGLLVGLIAAGVLLALVGLRWQEASYPPEAAPQPVIVGQNPSAPGAGSPAATAPAKPANQAQLTAAINRGKPIFAQKCASCHSLGADKLVGPGLKDVTQRRDRNWLVQFINQPDKVIASGDPIATQLVAEFGGLQMPNLGVTQAQASDILSYIEDESPKH